MSCHNHYIYTYVSLITGNIKRRTSTIIRNSGVCTHFHQHLHHRTVPIGRSSIQRRTTIAAPSVLIRTRLHQRPRTPHVSFPCGHMQRSPPLLIPTIQRTRSPHPHQPQNLLRPIKRRRHVELSTIIAVVIIIVPLRFLCPHAPTCHGPNLQPGIEKQTHHAPGDRLGLLRRQLGQDRFPPLDQAPGRVAVPAADGVAEESGPHERDLELVVLSRRVRVGGEPGADGVGVGFLRPGPGEEGVRGGLDEEAIGRGARVGGREVGLGLEDDLEGGAG
ncbi:hypothetical protein PanWU01x14_216380 [Parasponia andersonii]|uniref:Uncharacterized protein n=1 Tax=Parasponia andersonii TaxID=3476 RepID=A0A2P5BRN0_PARAD|nr:hypothetical protein PanWU01x14_216380 [Parasponia andersonii]